MGNPGSRAISEAGISPVTKIGNVRWTICAMLFAATTINYMDRSVIGLVKPTLMQSVANHGIGMTDKGYGYVTAAFMVAYALGLLVAGRFVDKVGTRIGYMMIMGVWSLSAMGHALANTMLEFGIARAFLGIGESGNFPAANKTNAEWFPQKERSFSFGIFNSGANVGAILAPAIVPWVVIHYGWHDCISEHRHIQRDVDSAVVHQIPQARRASGALGRRIGLHQPRNNREGNTRQDIVGRDVGHPLVGHPPDLGVCHPQISHRSHLVVLSFLAALLLQR